MSTDRGKGREMPLFGVTGGATASANVSVAADSWQLANITRYTCKLVPGTCTRVVQQRTTDTAYGGYECFNSTEILSTFGSYRPAYG
jgi:hypothetical protein